ncbi:MAG: hypothetical protein MUP97_17215 [Acidimicrobiia bacterium]|jgi:hypothetical protein|nr:hypothetical protein [Acidimicrobiia bacterium]
MTTVLVATDDGVQPFVDSAAGPRELAGHPVRALARRRDEWWAIADGTTVVRRDASGVWTDVATADTHLTCLLAASDGAWCGTADGRLLRLLSEAFAVVGGFDAIPGRETWKAVGSRVPYVRSITRTADDRSLLASVHVGGIARSGNGGASWEPTIDMQADVHEVRAHPSDPKVVLAPAAVGLATSRDAGATWDVTTEGLHATYLRAVTFTTDGALVSASDGPFTDRSALYRWDVATGGRLTKVEDGLPEWLDGNVDTGALDAHRDAAAFADDGGTVYASPDGGGSWTLLARDLGHVNAVGITA